MLNTYIVGLAPTAGATAEDLPVSTDAVSFANANAYQASTVQVLVTVSDADVMVTFDGSTPTSSHGHLYPEGSTVLWSKQMANAAQFIRAASTDAVVTATEFTK